MTLGIRDFNSHVGKKMDVFEGVHEGNRIGEQNLKDRMVLKFYNQKNLCGENTLFKKEKRKVTYSSGGNEAKIDFGLVEKESRKFLKDVR